MAPITNMRYKSFWKDSSLGAWVGWVGSDPKSWHDGITFTSPIHNQEISAVSRWFTSVKCLSECSSLNASQKAISVLSWVWWGFTPGRPVGRDNHRQGQSLSFPRYNFPVFPRYENLLSFSPFPNNNHSLGHFTSFWRQSLSETKTLCEKFVSTCVACSVNWILQDKNFWKTTFWNKKFLWNVGLQYVLHVDPIGYEKASSLIAPSTDVTHRRHIWGRK